MKRKTRKGGVFPSLISSNMLILQKDKYKREDIIDLMDTCYNNQIKIGVVYPIKLVPFLENNDEKREIIRLFGNNSDMPTNWHPSIGSILFTPANKKPLTVCLYGVLGKKLAEYIETAMPPSFDNIPFSYWQPEQEIQIVG